jgi:hypothetical protein
VWQKRDVELDQKNRFDHFADFAHAFLQNWFVGYVPPLIHPLIPSSSTVMFVWWPALRAVLAVFAALDNLGKDNS